MNILLHPIGIIHSPFKQLEKMPIQPAGAQSAQGVLEIYEPYIAALKDLEGFSHIYVIYFFHKSSSWKAFVKPFLDQEERGIFATRAPNRPNPLGLSVLKLLKLENNVIEVDHVDILDGTPLLDIKPYVPQFNKAKDVRIGWLSDYVNQVSHTLSDQRFLDDK